MSQRRGVVLDFFKEKIREYYRMASLELPQDLPFREIALQPFDADYYVRHLSFDSSTQLREYILVNVPRHLYYSSAKYLYPGNNEMSEKGWIGSDLVFDIDSNDIPDCSKYVIDFRFCPRCGYIAKSDEKECPYCHLELKKFEHVDRTCVEKAHSYLLKLIDIIENDFGFLTYKASFSGNRGFHLIVELSQPFDRMDSEARREIVSYITLNDFDRKYVVNMYMGSARERKELGYILPRATDGGLRRRIALHLLKRVSDENIKSFLMGYSEKIDYSKLVQVSEIISKWIEEILNELYIPIDSKVTIDISHLVRAPNSVNGKTGWKAFLIRNVSEFELDSYNVSISSGSELLQLRVLVDLPQLRIIDREFKARKGDIIVTEYPYASYLVFKNVAELVSIRR
ncbi:MAG: DNA primase small subunit domain-containing protein [Ignisphaera sp.]